MNESQRYRVFNTCKYDIGVKLINGIELNLKPGSFQLMTADDILFIETNCSKRKFFSEKMLVAKDNANKEIEFDSIGIYVPEDAHTHYSDDEVVAILKGSVKKIEDLVNKIEDPEEIYSIYEVAKKMDLPASKLRVLSSKMPDKDFFE